MLTSLADFGYTSDLNERLSTRLAPVLHTVSMADAANHQMRSNIVPGPQQSQEARNKAMTRRNWDKVEQHLTEVEKRQGFARAWELRQQLELGKITLDDLKRR